MTYNAFIKDILQTRGRFGLSKEIYQEKHHIIPRCLGGSDEETNIVALTAEEHFKAHWLLAEENPDNLSLQYALIFTTVSNKKNTNRYKPTEEEKQYLLELNRKIVSIDSASRMVCYHKDTHKVKRLKASQITDDYITGYPPEYIGPTKGIKMQQSQKDNLSKSKKGKYRGKHWYNNGNEEILAYTCPSGYILGRLEFSDVQKIKIARSSTGRLCSDKTKEKISKAKTGLHCYNNGEVTIRAKECPEGFKPGLLKKDKRTCKFYTNGITNKKIYDGDTIPEGFTLGIAPNEKLQHRRWWTNGLINKWSQICPGDDFYLGKI